MAKTYIPPAHHLWTAVIADLAFAAVNITTAVLLLFSIWPMLRQNHRLGEAAMPGPHDHHDHHDHSHGGDHHHDHDNQYSDMQARVKALETLLTDKGLIDPAAIDAIVETYETKVGPRNGAQVVAKAWSDPEFAEWLRRDATAAIASLGFAGRQGEHMRAVFNTADTHNLVVCTLCSCYPWAVLGLPPVWYKAPAYRSRAVIDPRGVLEEFGVTLDAAKKIRVWDSTAELRYLVVPERPAGTDGLSAAELADLVTRDSMIGTGLAGLTGLADLAGHAKAGL